MARVTLKQIAQKLGVSTAAVSMALRNQPSVSPSLRERVQKVAASLGYNQNPLVSAYQAHVRAGRTRRYRATIAWIDDAPSGSGWTSLPYKIPFFKGARTRAESFGYKVDLVRMPFDRDAHTTVAQMQRVLRNRGVFGVILPQLYYWENALEDWPDMAVVLLGSHKRLLKHELTSGPVVRHHLVDRDYFRNTRNAYVSLQARGYKRIGFFSTDWEDWNSDGMSRAGFIVADNAAGADIPPLLLKGPADNPAHVSPLGSYVRKHRLDALICLNADVLRSLSQLGIGVGSAFGLAHLALAGDVENWSGIDPRDAEIGATAAEMVIDQLTRNERSVPSCAHEVFIRGVWMDGTTARPRPA